MALTRAENLSGISIGAGEKAQVDKEPKPLRLTAEEINYLMITTPAELTPDNSVVTPVGTWSYDEGIPIFDPISEDALRLIEIPSFGKKSITIWERAKAAIIKYGRLD